MKYTWKLLVQSVQNIRHGIEYRHYIHNCNFCNYIIVFLNIKI